MRYFQRFKVISLFLLMVTVSTTTWAFSRDELSGTWYHGNQTTSIEKRGHHRYLFCNENNDCAMGMVTGDRSIQVGKWSVTGVLHINQKVISWSNGTKWVRMPIQKINIAGRWFHHGQPTQIRVNQGGKNFFLTNEMGQTSWGYVQGNRLTLPTLNIVGYLSPDGRQINWSNNTTWIRY